MHTHRSRNEQSSTVCSGHFPLLVSVPSSSRTHTYKKIPGGSSPAVTRAVRSWERPGPQASGFLPTPVQLPRVWRAGACGASAPKSSPGPAAAGKREPCAPPLRLRPVPSQLHRPEVPGPRRRPAGLGPRDVAWIGPRPDHVQQRRRAGARPALGGTAGPGVPAHPWRPVQSGADGKKSGVAWRPVHGAAPGLDPGSTARPFDVPNVPLESSGNSR